MRNIRLSQKAFTLVEMLAVLLLLGVVLGIAGPAIFKQVEKGRIRASQVQIAAFDQSLTAYNLDCGSFPTSVQGLAALLSQPTAGRKCKDYDPDGYVKGKSVPLDQWKQDYIYSSPGQNNPSSYDIFSKGPDKIEGTDDDITNWE